MPFRGITTLRLRTTVLPHINVFYIHIHIFKYYFQISLKLCIHPEHVTLLFLCISKELDSSFLINQAPCSTTAPPMTCLTHTGGSFNTTASPGAQMWTTVPFSGSTGKITQSRHAAAALQLCPSYTYNCNATAS